MMNNIYREFVGIVNYLLSHGEPWIKNDRLIVKRARLVKLMDQHPYLTSADKFSIWKNLHWIDCESGCTRKRVRVGDKILTVIQIDIGVYKQLAEVKRLSASDKA